MDVRVRQKPIKPFRVGKSYAVVWADHFDISKTWARMSEIDVESGVQMVTYGLCIHDADDYVTLAGTAELDSADPVYSQVFRCLKSDIRSAALIKY